MKHASPLRGVSWGRGFGGFGPQVTKGAQKKRKRKGKGRERKREEKEGKKVKKKRKS